MEEQRGVRRAVGRARDAAAEGLELTADEVMTLADARAACVFPYPDQPIDTALRVRRGQHLVPVVHRADPQRLMGIVTLDDVLRAVS